MCKGFIVDFEKITEGILDNDKDLIQRINEHNKQFHPNSFNYISFEALKIQLQKRI